MYVELKEHPMAIKGLKVIKPEVVEKLIWLSSGDAIPVNKMSDHHLNAVRNKIASSEKQIINGVTKEDWLTAFDGEKQRRDKLGDLILNRFKSYRDFMQMIDGISDEHNTNIFKPRKKGNNGADPNTNRK